MYKIGRRQREASGVKLLKVAQLYMLHIPIVQVRVASCDRGIRLVGIMRFIESVVVVQEVEVGAAD